MAQFIDFPEANKSLGPPSDMTADTCGTLRVHTDGTTCISRWQPTPEELAQLNAGGSLWLGVRSGSNQPAVWLSAYQPDFADIAAAAAAEADEALHKFAARLPAPEYAGTRPMTGRELLLLNSELMKWEGGFMQPDEVYFVSSPEIQQAHYQALRTAYAEGGQPAVVAYLKPYREFLHSPETQPVY